MVSNVIDTEYKGLAKSDEQKIRTFMLGSGNQQGKLLQEGYDRDKHTRALMVLWVRAWVENDKGTMSFYSLNECRKFVRQRVECVHQLKPDMIVLGGLSFLTKMASRITRVPSCSVVSSSIYDFYYHINLDSFIGTNNKIILIVYLQALI